MKIKVSDYIAKKLVELGARDVFSIVGGPAMHLNQSFANNKDLNVYYMHHEQACGFAADGYARIAKRPAVVCVSSGPGSTNMVTPVLGCYQDSIPMIVISAQVRYETTMLKLSERALETVKVRQLGDQECDITDIIKSITKYSVMIVGPESIRYCLEKAWCEAMSFRKGPVWLDICLNVSEAEIEEDDLKGFDPSIYVDIKALNDKILPKEEDIYKIFNLIESAKSPVIYAGDGIHLADAEEEFLKFVDKLKIPVVTTWGSQDLIEYKQKYNYGKASTIGERSANCIVQNSDMLLILGSRLSVRQTGFKFDKFANKAYKIMIDIDENEMNKGLVEIDYKIHADLKAFLKKTNEYPEEFKEKKDWLNWCSEIKDVYECNAENYKYENDDKKVNPYKWFSDQWDSMLENEIVVSANATPSICGFQVAKTKKGQRMIANGGIGAMGWALPAGIGACIADKKRNVRIWDGDGSFMLNCQEMSTIYQYSLPILIYVICNGGYNSIKQTHQNYFGSDKVIGSLEGKDLTLPDYEELAEAFMRNQTDEHYFELKEIHINPDQDFYPKGIEYDPPEKYDIMDKEGDS